MNDEHPLLQISSLQKIVAGRPALEVADLQVKSGAIVALVGPAGSGKRTLLNLVLGREAPTAGTVRVAGVDPRLDRGALSRAIGVLFGEDGLYRQRTAAGNLRFFARLHGLPDARVEATLTFVGLQDQAQTRVDRLSTGLCRRLALGVALLHQPALLLLEDPFARCDETSIELIGSRLRQQADAGTAVVIIAGSDAYLTDLCDTIYALERGRLKRVASQRETRHDPLPFKIPVRLEGSVALINPAEILFASAQDGRAVLQLADASLPTQYSLGELEERLGRSGFFRAHRSYLVNLQHVREVIPYTRATYTLRLNDSDATEVPLSRDAARELRALLDF